MCVIRMPHMVACLYDLQSVSPFCAQLNDESKINTVKLNMNLLIITICA